jgi:hypothetical protein
VKPGEMKAPPPLQLIEKLRLNNLNILKKENEFGK